MGDPVTFVAAIAAATFYALFARPFGDYHYWFSWRKAAFAAGVLLYFLVGGVGAGALGWLVGVASHAEPTSFGWVNGILFGLVGALAIRAELGAPKSRKAPSEEEVASQFSPAVTLLNIGTVWTFDMVDRLVTRSIETWLRTLTDKQVRTVALELAQRVGQLDGVPDPAKVAILSRLTSSMEHLAGAEDENQREEPRIQLRGFALTLFRQYRWSRPG